MDSSASTALSTLSTLSTLSNMLPLEIIVHIGLTSPEAWRSMLAIPSFARWTMSNQARNARCSFLYCRKDMDIDRYYLGNLLHNFNDLPALVQTDGIQIWYQCDDLHRDNDKPAVIYANGVKEWYQNGKIIATTSLYWTNLYSVQKCDTQRSQ